MRYRATGTGTKTVAGLGIILLCLTACEPGETGSAQQISGSEPLPQTGVTAELPDRTGIDGAGNPPQAPANGQEPPGEAGSGSGAGKDSGTSAPGDGGNPESGKPASGDGGNPESGKPAPGDGSIPEPPQGGEDMPGIGSSKRIPQDGEKPFPGGGIAPSGIEIAQGAELLMLADSRGEAERVATLYGIELVEYSYGVATFHTEENPQTVINRGIENGWPRLDLNTITRLDDPVGPGYRIAVE